MTQILDCCRELGRQANEVYEPKLVFCVVQKRHHTRMFPTSPQDADKSGNLPAGELGQLLWGVCMPADSTDALLRLRIWLPACCIGNSPASALQMPRTCV